MQVVFSYIYEFAIEFMRFDTLSCVLVPIFYLKGYNNLYFYKLSTCSFGRKRREIENSTLDDFLFFMFSFLVVRNGLKLLKVQGDHCKSGLAIL